MNNTSPKNQKVPAGTLQRIAIRALSRSSTNVAFGVAILLVDLVTGSFLQFPILFVLPVASSAWFRNSRLAYVLAVLLPIGRHFISEIENSTAPLFYLAINCVTRIAVLVLIAYLTARTSRQNQQLKQQVDSLVTVCAWSRTVEYQGEWISFEEYLLRRFNVNASHGISPEEARKLCDHPGNSKNSGT